MPTRFTAPGIFAASKKPGRARASSKRVFFTSRETAMVPRRSGLWRRRFSTEPWVSSPMTVVVQVEVRTTRSGASPEAARVSRSRSSFAAGGYSLRDYERADGEVGVFQDRFNVYDREGQPCERCPGPPACDDA